MPSSRRRDNPATRFSRTVSRENNPRPSGTTAIAWRRTRTCVSTRSSESPSHRIFPRVCINPRIDLIVVVLPAPFAPTRARHCPSSSTKLTSNSACVLPYQACTPPSSSIVLDPEIRFAYRARGEHLIGGPRRDQPSGIHRDGVSAQPSNEVDIVLDHDHHEGPTCVEGAQPLAD